MAQALVPLNAPGEMRGRVIGVFGMTAIGFRAFSGATGSVRGIRRSLAASALILGAIIAVMAGALRVRATPVAAGD